MGRASESEHAIPPLVCVRGLRDVVLVQQRLAVLGLRGAEGLRRTGSPYHASRMAMFTCGRYVAHVDAAFEAVLRQFVEFLEWVDHFPSDTIAETEFQHLRRALLESYDEYEELSADLFRHATTIE